MTTLAEQEETAGLPPGPETKATSLADFRPPNVPLTTLGLALASFMPVSYTHLDVYKRQPQNTTASK